MFVPAPASAGYEIRERGDKTQQLLASAGDSTLPAPAPVPPGGIMLDVSYAATPRVGRTPVCEPAGQGGITYVDDAAPCAVTLGPMVLLTVRGDRAVPLDHLRGVAESTRATGGWQTWGAWVAVTEAFPTSAQVPRD